MKVKIITLGILIGCMTIPLYTYAQDDKIEVEDSAEVFLEEYSDEFQEKFFEALKQKGIENYDRAINLFLECKLLDANNVVLDHELAKVYMADKQYLQAQEYSIETLVSEPSNTWYLNTLVEILQKQGNSFDNIKSNLPYKNVQLKENLALIYFKQDKYQASKAVLKDLQTSSFTQELNAKIDEAITSRAKRQAERQKTSFSATNERRVDPLQTYTSRIKGQIMAKSFFQLEKTATEALEEFPNQPYFYYAQGLSLVKKRKHKEAIEILEAGLDYLLGNNISLENDIYKTLADAYLGLNNTVKANMYLRKVKPGF